MFTLYFIFHTFRIVLLVLVSIPVVPVSVPVAIVLPLPALVSRSGAAQRRRKIKKLFLAKKLFSPSKRQFLCIEKSVVVSAAVP